MAAKKKAEKTRKDKVRLGRDGKPMERRAPRVIGECLFCKEKVVPTYRDVEMLQKFVTDRGKIVPRGRSGVCPKHQRRLAQEVKRARHLALLAFHVKV